MPVPIIAQPLLDTIARLFYLTQGPAGLIVTVAQIGYATGLMFLIPLADICERKRIIVGIILLDFAVQAVQAAHQNAIF